MRIGVEVIYQAVLFDGRRLGFADFLRRVEEPSDLGNWSYEVWNTKLAGHAKAAAVLQLCMYSNLLGDYQGRAPSEMHLALVGVMGETVSFRVADYAAYYRMVAREFKTVLDAAPAYPPVMAPEPVEHCGVSRWSEKCRAQWRAEDDLQENRREHPDSPCRAYPAFAQRLDRIGREALQRIHAQASIQVRGEQAGAILSELIPPPRDRQGDLVPNQGLLMLSLPSPGDLFFDMEGDRYRESDEI